MSDFVAWLAGQVDRDDPVGDIARDVAADYRGGGTNPRTAGGIRTRMTKFGAVPAAFEALDRAVAEWADSDAGRGPLVDPERATHEINPDAWHADLGLDAAVCRFCAEEAK